MTQAKKLIPSDSFEFYIELRAPCASAIESDVIKCLASVIDCRPFATC